MAVPQTHDIPATTVQPGDTFHLLGTLITFRATNATTGGAYTLVDVLVAPGGGAPPNTHPGDDETFFILEGSIEFTVGQETKVYGPGACIIIPNGGVHTFRNIGEEPARMLIINRPGLLHEYFFSTAGDAVPSGTTSFPEIGAPDIPKIMGIAERCGMKFHV